MNKYLKQAWLGLRYFLPVLLCLVIAALAYYQDILPLNHELAMNRQQEQILARQLQQLYYQEITFEERVLRLPETEAMLNDWQKKFIRRSDLGKLLKEIVALSKRDNLRVDLLESTPASEENHYLKQPYKIILLGDYVQVANFIAQVANLPWLVVVESFALTRVLPYKTSLLFTAELDLNVYYLI